MAGAATRERYENVWVETETSATTPCNAILVVLHQNPMREGVALTPRSRPTWLAAFSATSASEHLGHTTLPQPRTLRHPAALGIPNGAEERTPVRRTAAVLAALHAGLEGAVQPLRTMSWPRMFRWLERQASKQGREREGER